ncbi:MAG: hypothetical protein K2M09_02820 [Muribaculaceae bacterium]|nr:hypothetical protein [Muribaculaceae bacterium]MDE6262222.1 hypothetical protein [Muribaculaceae bacterium]
MVSDGYAKPVFETSSAGFIVEHVDAVNLV